MAYWAAFISEEKSTLRMKNNVKQKRRMTMSRFEKQYQTNGNNEIIFGKIAQFLVTSGYTRETYNGEYVFKKGSGWFAAPKYIKIDNIGGNCIKLQAWIKWVLLPNLFIGEFDPTQGTFAGAIDKSKLNATVNAVDSIILHNNTANESEGQKAAVPDMRSAYEASAITESNSPGADCYAASPAGTLYDRIPETIDRSLISKKEFAEKYAAANVRNDIKNAAITGYICSGLTFALGALAVSPAVMAMGVIVLGLVLGFHLSKSKACAIIWLALVSLDCIVSLLAVGKPSGWLMIIAGVWAVKSLNKLEKDYETFRGEN